MSLGPTRAIGEASEGTITMSLGPTRATGEASEGTITMSLGPTRATGEASEGTVTMSSPFHCPTSADRNFVNILKTKV